MRLTRRDFARSVSSIGAGLWLGALPGPAVSQSANEQLNVAFVGVGKGGVGGVANLPAISGLPAVRVAALCDIDDQYAGPSYAKHPKAPRYHDFRRMLDRQKDIDAVVVSTPDHTHAVISVEAMRRGKHVYCEKPVARTIYEARVMQQVAAKHNVVTQMGNQGTGEPKFRLLVDLIRSGTLGTVREVHAWTNRPTWPQGDLKIPKQRPAVPKYLKWDLFLGPAAERHYHAAYHPFVWRGWWDFGTCVLGDMACHITNHAFFGLDLGSPTRVEAVAEGHNEVTGPKSAVIRYDFPARGQQPPVRMTWYEGGRQPPKEVWHGWKAPLPTNGALLIGDKGAVITLNMYGWDWRLLPAEKWRDYKRPEEEPPRGHHYEWVLACRGQAKTRSNFDYACPMTESLLVGNLAIRTGRPIDWDAQAMKATNCPEADELIRPEFRKGWSLKADD